MNEHLTGAQADGNRSVRTRLPCGMIEVKEYDADGNLRAWYREHPAPHAAVPMVASPGETIKLRCG